MENKDACKDDEAVTVATPESIVTTDKVQESEVPATVTASNGPTKPRNKEEKSRKKEDKSVDHVLKALNSLDSTEEKLAAMCKKYADIFDEHRKLQILLKQTEKRCIGLQKEKEQLQTEHSKAILTRSRLENLCRELQRQNKAIKDENLLKIREEEEKRKEVSAKFQNTLSEITTLMQQNNDKNMKLRDDNIDMTTKLKNVCEQYELREQQVEKIAKQMLLESQLADAKLAKVKMEMAAEKEILLREKQQLLMELTQYQARCQEAQATEVSLRNQISLYNDKYDEFQKALERSNNVFGGFKGEMEKMSKKICKLEKETSSWKQRWERSHGALLEMAEDKKKSEQELSVSARQLAALQNLCRTLQTERAQLLARLKAIESVPSVQQAVEPVKDELPVVEYVHQEVKQCTATVENVEQEITQNQGQEINGHVLPEQEIKTTVSDQYITVVSEPSITAAPEPNTIAAISNFDILEPVESKNSIVPPCSTDSSLTPSVSLVNTSNNVDNCTTVEQPSPVATSEQSCQNSNTEPLVLHDVCQNGTEETSDDSNSADSLKHKPVVGTPDSVKVKESSKKKRK